MTCGFEAMLGTYMGASPKGSGAQSSATGTVLPGLLSATAGQGDLHNV